MNISEEFLIGIASIAIALIGFSGVVTALGRRGEGKWSPAEMLQLKTLVEPSIVSLLGAFLPIVLSLSIQNPDVLWRTSNAFLTSLHLVGFVSFVIRGQDSGIEFSHKLMLSLFLLILFFLLASIFNFVSAHQQAFALGVLYGICAAIHNFYLLLFYSNKNSSE